MKKVLWQLLYQTMARRYGVKEVYVFSDEWRDLIQKIENKATDFTHENKAIYIDACTTSNLITVLIGYKVDSNIILQLIDETDVDLLDFCGSEERIPQYTSLMAALYHKRFDIVKKLISKGVDVHLKYIDDDGITNEIPYEQIAKKCGYDGNDFFLKNN